MANQKHFNILMQGVKGWNQWRTKHLEIKLDLSRTDHSGADLSGANFRYADLRYANLGGANLGGANLGGASLGGASLSGADLSGADLSGADLSRADLSRADLSRADLSRAILSDAILSNAILQDGDFSEVQIVGTGFVNDDLSVVKGLETVRHKGPSHLSTDTLIKSKGQIPESFLRGCGLSDWEIESAKLYNPNLSNEEINNIYYRIHDLRVCRAFQINPLFISYSHADSDFVSAIDKHLTKQGVRFWRDIHDAKAGRLE